MEGTTMRVGVIGAFMAACAAVLALAYGRNKAHGAEAPGGADKPVSSAPDARGMIEITMSSSDGKKDWLEEVTRGFHAQNPELDGKRIKVKLLHMKSGESMQSILAGKEKPTLWSPAGGAWVEQINASYRARTGHAFMEATRPTVKSALVLAMWEPMARALGWPGRPIGWSDVFEVAMTPGGWASRGHAEWGTFRFGHAHPDFSTSAMLSVVSSIYAASGKRVGLTPEDVDNPQVVARVGALERAIVHYGESSSWLTEKLCTKGPAYLSAVPLYEASVIKANDKYRGKMPFPLVAVYPKEGTFWEDHPTGVVSADWVSDEQRRAAERYLAHLVSKESQVAALTHGYRPTEASVPLSAPVDAAHGADPAEPRGRPLEYVSEATFRRANELWHRVKKHSSVVMVLDTSGSMSGEPINAAKKAAARFIRSMEKDDEVAVIAFSSSTKMLRPMAPVREVGEQLAAQVEGLFADGGTALYDATLAALDEVDRVRRERSDRLYGVVLLSDGQDTSSRRALSDVLGRMPASEVPDGTRLFTVGYGKDADVNVLSRFAHASNARYLTGTSDTIEKVYHEIASYF